VSKVLILLRDRKDAEKAAKDVEAVKPQKHCPLL